MHAPVALTLVSMFLLAPAGAAAQTKNFERTAALDSGGRLSVTTDVSTLRLTAWDRNEVEVIARIRPRDEMPADYARRAVEATDIVVEGDARGLTVRADYSRVPRTGILNGNSRMLPHIDYEIRAPRRLQLSVNVDRSTADISGFEGTLELESDRTRFHASDLSGDVRLNIDRGGDVRIENVRGSVRFDADRSDVTVRQLTLTGDSHIDVGRGQLDLFLASDAGLTLSVDRERRSQFDIDFPLTTRTLGGDRIEGTINGGGPRLSIATDRARVNLRNP
jgi:hypothetical protein